MIDSFHESGTIPVRRLVFTMRNRHDPMEVKHILTNLMHKPSTPADVEFFMRDKTRRSSPRLTVRTENATVGTRGNLTGRSGPDLSTWAAVRGPRFTKYLLRASASTSAGRAAPSFLPATTGRTLRHTEDGPPSRSRSRIALRLSASILLRTCLFSRL